MKGRGHGAKLKELNAFAAQGAVAPAWELFQLLKAAASPGQLPPLGGAGESENELRLERRFVWNTMLKAYANAGDEVNARVFYKSMLSAQVVPNAKTYGKLMEAAAKRGETPTARAWMTQMERDNIKPGILHYSQLMASAAHAANLAEAEMLDEEVRSLGLVPTETYYNSLLNACAKAGDLASCRRWYQEMLLRGFQPTSLTYSTLISAGRWTGDALSGLAWARQWPRTSLEAYHAFMDLAAVHQDLHLAVRSFHELTQVFMPSVTTYNTLLLAFARGGDLRAAQQWLRRMVALTEEPNEVTYRILIQCCAQAGDLLSAAGYLEEMEAQHLTVDVTTRNILANAAAEAGDAAFAKEWLQSLRSTTTTPDAFSFNAVLKAQLAAGDLPGAEEHFHKFFAAAGRTVQPDLTTFGMLINAYAEVKDHRQALSWLRAMPRCRLSPTVVQYTQVLKSFTEEEKSTGERLFREMVEDAQLPTQVTLKVLRRLVGPLRTRRLLEDLDIDESSLEPLVTADAQKRRWAESALRRQEAQVRKRVSHLQVALRLTRIWGHDVVRLEKAHPGNPSQGANLLLMGIKDQNMVGKVYMCGQALSDEGLVSSLNAALTATNDSVALSRDEYDKRPGSDWIERRGVGGREGS
ncbi:unnamed protein product [Durusdinium trenchii]|uniref:PROP1-like PPR domain-containing protein n=4 Tax=Durusdinium trenchii TaxID=1381693 RepID=A0ABP0S5V4_9DINO